MQHLTSYCQFRLHLIVYQSSKVNVPSFYEIWRKSLFVISVRNHGCHPALKFSMLSFTPDWSPSVGRRHIEVLRRYCPTQPCSSRHCRGYLGRRSRILQVHQQVAFGIGMCPKSFNLPIFVSLGSLPVF